MNEAVIEHMRGAFERHFGAAPSYIVRAPGRVNLIGEHTDYNQGFVMPLAINRAAWMAARQRNDREVLLRSENFDRDARFSLDGVEKDEGEDTWSDYVRGVAYILQDVGCSLRGMDAVVWGDVPIGAGLSSSAALEVASIQAFATVANLRIKALDVALFAQRAEVEFVGVNCGIMDQMISALGVAGHALAIDCRTLDYQAVPLPDELTVVIADTMKRRGLVDSKYNERRRECEKGARLLGASSLRDVTPEMLEARQNALPDRVMRRCRHVITENVRVLACAEALTGKNFAAAGELLRQSHVSLRDEYEVSSPELDLMVDLAFGQPGIIGARMTGAGFGGCTVNLVSAGCAQKFAHSLTEKYAEKTGVKPSLYISTATAGAQVF